MLASRGALPLTAPLDAASGGLAVLDGLCCSTGLLVIMIGSRTTPAPEVSLMLLLETAISPVLVFAFVGERPSAATCVAGVGIVITLAGHSVAEAMAVPRSGGGAAGRAVCVEDAEVTGGMMELSSLLTATPSEEED